MMDLYTGNAIEQTHAAGRLDGIFGIISAFTARMLKLKGPAAHNPQLARPSAPLTVSFLKLAEQNIYFYDHQGQPLYGLDKLLFGQPDAEILKKMLLVFDDLVPEVRVIPMLTKGRYAHIPIDQILYKVTEADLASFLAHVQQHPKGYVGKQFRITEAFAGWIVSGAPLD